MKMLSDVSTRPCEPCNHTGQLLAGFTVIGCVVCSGRGFLDVDCFLCRDTMMLGGIPCACATLGGAA